LGGFCFFFFFEGSAPCLILTLALIRLADLERKQKGFHDKLGRSRVFKTKKDRDQFLTSEIEAINDTIKNKQAQAKALTAEIAALKTKIQAQREMVTTTGAKLVADQKKLLDDSVKDLEERQQKRDALAEDKKSVTFPPPPSFSLEEETNLVWSLGTIGRSKMNWNKSYNSPRTKELA